MHCESLRISDWLRNTLASCWTWLAFILYLETCHGHCDHVEHRSSSSDPWDRYKCSKDSKQQIIPADCRGGQRKARGDPVVGQGHGPVDGLASEGKCRCQSGCWVLPKEEGLALHIRGPLQLCDRTEAPACLSDRWALLEPVLRADQADTGREHMAQISEQACTHWEACRGHGWCLHVGQGEDSRGGNPQVWIHSFDAHVCFRHTVALQMAGKTCINVQRCITDTTRGS